MSAITLTHKIRLDPTCKQENYFRQACGVARFTYKAHMRGNHIEIVDRWFPSSKRCSTCGKINGGLSLSDRMFRCGDGGLEIDRDLNAAINLFRTVSSSGCQACGEEGSGLKKTLGETGLGEAGTKPCTDLYTF